MPNCEEHKMKRESAVDSLEKLNSKVNWLDWKEHLVLFFEYGKVVNICLC